MRDDLTGFFSRHQLHKELSEWISQAQREKPLALLLFQVHAFPFAHRGKQIPSPVLQCRPFYALYLLGDHQYRLLAARLSQAGNFDEFYLWSGV